VKLIFVKLILNKIVIISYFVIPTKKYLCKEDRKLNIISFEGNQINNSLELNPIMNDSNFRESNCKVKKSSWQRNGLGSLGFHCLFYFNLLIGERKVSPLHIDNYQFNYSLLINYSCVTFDFYFAQQSIELFFLFCSCLFDDPSAKKSILKV